MGENEITARLWLARFLQDRELQLELESARDTEGEELQLEECVYGNDPYNSIGRSVRR